MCIWSTIQSCKVESTVSNKTGHLTLAAYSITKTTSKETASSSYYSLFEQNWLELVLPKVVFHFLAAKNEEREKRTLTAERELSPQLSQRTPSKSKAYRSPISSKDNILLASTSLPATRPLIYCYYRLDLSWVLFWLLNVYNCVKNSFLNCYLFENILK